MESGPVSNVGSQPHDTANYIKTHTFIFSNVLLTKHTEISIETVG
jgi:hypothetical protein